MKVTVNRDHGGAAAASASPIEITSAPVRVAILAEPLVCPTLAADLVTRLKLVPITETDTPDYTHYLHLTTERLELREQSSGTTGPLYVDFVAGRAAHRRRFGGGR
ncbi:MAG: class I SAM-dependent methyltransferase, partial [Candidatus Competibacter sp.]|nr:class I SAM-dependent methyltransferase [Candidatus Competibacter sp.]